MEFKDTVMSQTETTKLIDKWLNGEMDARHVSGAIAEAQAEISFKAGYKYALEGAVIEGGYESVKKAGIREVVEWAEQNDPNNSFWKSQCWQEQKKEWGIKDG